MGREPEQSGPVRKGNVGKVVLFVRKGIIERPWRCGDTLLIGFIDICLNPI